MIEARGKVVWISHRGIRTSRLTENTLAAYELAVQSGFEWLETDLRLTKDNHIVLSHDPDFKRIIDSELFVTKNISDMTRTEIESIGLPCGGNILFLDKFLRTFSGLNWVFDVKIETAKPCLKALRSLLDQMSRPDELEQKITFLLWTKGDEKLARQLFPSSKFFAQKGECYRAGISAILGLPFLSGVKPERAYAVPPKLWGIKLFNKRIFKTYHAGRGKIIAYLPDRKVDLQAAIDAGADLILSDGIILTPPRDVGLQQTH